MSGDLVLLAADHFIEQALEGLLRRPRALAIRAVDFRVVVHPQQDPGCYAAGADLLAPLSARWRHALVVFDRAWEGAPSSDPRELEAHVEKRLRPRWGDRGRCIVIDPEVEVWVWSDSPHVADALGWPGRMRALRRWLESAGLWARATPKPADPKRAFEEALRKVRVPPSASIVRILADRVSVRRCADQSFARLRETLGSWFPPTGARPGMPADSVRPWLRANGYGDVADLVEEVMAKWIREGVRTRRNWWDVLAGDDKGRPVTVAGHEFPVLRSAQIRKGRRPTRNAIQRRRTERPPPIRTPARRTKRR